MKARIALAVILGMCLALPVRARAQDTGLPVGTKVPSALLQTLDGKTVNLADVAKGPAVVEFWATWCESCEALLPAVKAAHAKYGKRVQFVGVAVSVNQSAKRVGLYVAKHGVPGVQLYDTKGNATGAWDVPATSHVVVVDRAGRVVYTGVGGDQNLDAVLAKLN